jgi:Ala-tRNA(Pro) deacylase
MPNRLLDFLDRKRVKYLRIHHSPAYSAQDLAAATHVHGWELAKVTMLNVDDQLVMAVLPAPLRVDLAKIQRTTGARRATIADESEFAAAFPDCERGAMPPFGNLYALAVYVDERLADDDAIVFHAGRHDEALRMKFVDFRRLVEPVILDLADA